MEGILISLAREEKWGRVDTRNDDLGTLTIYFQQVPEALPLQSTVEFELVKSRAGKYYAKFVSAADRNQALFNTEDRAQWYGWGEGEEKAFLERVVPRLGIDLRLNPEKEQKPWEIDLYDYTNRRYADLKTQNTPFFTAGKYFYGRSPYDPTYTVTFNKKDYENYLENHPDCDIYFWVCWQQLTYKNIRVKALCGVWRAPFRRLADKIQAGEVALHTYRHRVDDDHNAKDSYLFDLADTAVFQRLI